MHARFGAGASEKGCFQYLVGVLCYQTATQEHAPQQVRACPSLRLLQQVWDQHFERIDGVVRGLDGLVVANTGRVVSPYETDARESRKRDTEWLGDIRAFDRDLFPRGGGASDRASPDHGGD